MRFVRNIGGCLGIGVLLSLPAFSGSGGTDTFILAIERVKHAVVPVLCGTIDANQQFKVQLIDGTGFFIDAEGRFVTAAHVIRGLSVVNVQQPLPCVWAIYVPENGWQRDAINLTIRWFQFGNCAVDDNLDLAVCKTVIVPKGVEPMLIDDNRPADGTPVAFTGFPLGSVEPLSSRGDIATYRNAIDGDGSREMVIDKGTWPGASGSPVYEDNGSVLGIVLQRGLGDGTGIAVARPSHFILKFLNANGVSVRRKEDKKRKRKK